MLFFTGYFSGEHRKKSIMHSDTEQKVHEEMKKHGSSRINILGKYGIFADYFQYFSVIAIWPLFLKRERRHGYILYYHDDQTIPFSWRDDSDRDCIEEKLWWKREKEINEV